MFLEAFDQIKDQIILPKLLDMDKMVKRFKVNSKYGAESILDKGMAGATAYLATKSPLFASVSPILFDVLKQRSEDRMNIDENLKDPINQAINDKYGKGANKATANAVRKLDRMKRKDPEGFKNSEQYREFGSIYETLRQEKPKEKKTEESSGNGPSGSSVNNELLQKIADNTERLVNAFDKKEDKTDTSVVGMPTASSTNVLNQMSTATGAKLNPLAAGIGAGSLANTKPNLPPLLSGMFMRAGIPTGSGESTAGGMEAEEAAKEQQMVMVQESNETQTLLSEIKETLIKTNEEEKKKEEVGGSTGNGIISSIIDSVGDILSPGKRRRAPNAPRPSGGRFGGLKSIFGMGGAAATTVGVAEAAGAIDLIPDSSGKQTTVPDTSNKQSLPNTKPKGGMLKGAGGLLKSVVKKIPLIGALAGLGFAGSRLMDGDVKGAGLEAMGGLLGSIPFAGTALSLGTDAILSQHDAEKENTPVPAPVPAESTLKESKIFNSKELMIAGEPVDANKELSTKQFAEIETMMATSSESVKALPSYVMEKFNTMKTAVFQGAGTKSDMTSKIMASDTTSTSAANNSIYSLTENVSKTQSEREKEMMKSSSAPVIINNSSTTTGSSSGGGTYKPFVRNPESTLSKLHERDYWGRAK